MTLLRDELASSGTRRLARISRETGISVDRLRELAAGAEATLSEARRLAVALRQGVDSLVGATSDAETRAQVLFRRSWASAGDHPVGTDVLAKRVGTTVDLMHAHQDEALIRWRDRFAPPEPTIENAELNATTYRVLFFDNDQLSPFVELPRVVSEQMGVLLFVVRSADMDGASAFLNGIPFAFVSERFPPRMLFTLAHEVGHLIVHHKPDGDSAIVDEDIEAPARRDQAEIENYANTFASALLMPRQAVAVALRTIRRVARATDDAVGDIEINYLARIFGVSFWAAARRCEDLELLPRGGAFALNEQLAKKHGSAERRADELGLPPRPEVRFPVVPPSLLRSAVVSINAGEISIGRASGILGVSVAELFKANSPTRH